MKLRLPLLITLGMALYSCRSSDLKIYEVSPSSEIFNAYLDSNGKERLKAGVALSPRNSKSYVSNTSAPISKQWGTEYFIDVIKKSSNQLWQENNGINLSPEGKKVYSDRTVVGDISFENGGRMPGHVSHFWGLDADFAYFSKEGSRAEQTRGAGTFVTSKGTSPQFDALRLLRFVELFHHYSKSRCSEVLYVFVDWRIKKSLQKSFVLREKSKPSNKRLDLSYFEKLNFNAEAKHSDHFHIRIAKAPKDHCYFNNENSNTSENADTYSDYSDPSDPRSTQYVDNDSEYSALAAGWLDAYLSISSFLVVSDYTHAEEDLPAGDTLGYFTSIQEARIWSADSEVKDLGTIAPGTKFYVTQIYQQEDATFYEFEFTDRIYQRSVLINSNNTKMLVPNFDSEKQLDYSTNCISQVSDNKVEVLSTALNLRSEKRTLWNRPRIDAFAHGIVLESFGPLADNKDWIRVRGVTKSNRVMTGVVHHKYVTATDKHPDHFCR